MDNTTHGHEAGYGITSGKGNTIIGVGSDSKHNYCVVIGTGIESDHDYQIKIGNTKHSKSRTMTSEEYESIHTTLRELLNWGAPK